MIVAEVAEKVAVILAGHTHQSTCMDKLCPCKDILRDCPEVERELKRLEGEKNVECLV